MVSIDTGFIGLNSKTGSKVAPKPSSVFITNSGYTLIAVPGFTMVTPIILPSGSTLG